MDRPPGDKKPSNVTIQLDRDDLDQILLVNTESEAPPPVSVPPPLPPEEIARAASLAPVGSAASPPAGHPSRGLLPYILISVGLCVAAAAATGGILLVSHRSPPPAASIASASPVAAPSASEAPSAQVNTITIHTVELGGKSSTEP